MIHSLFHTYTKKTVLTSVYILIASVTLLGLMCFSSTYGYRLDLENQLITDQADVLTDDQEKGLESQLLNIEKEHNTQIAIVTLQSLWGEDPAQVAVDIAQSNGIWKDGIDSGALVLIAIDERKRRIETWYWLEWPIPDILANRLGENVLAPAFRRWDYAWGLSQVLTIMWELLDGEFDGFTEPQNDDIDADLFGAFLIYGAMAMFFFGSMYKALQKDTKKRTTWIFASWAWLWLLAMLILWWWAFILILIYVVAGLFGWFADTRWGRRWSSWFGSFGWGSFWRGFGWRSSFGWWGFGWFGWGSFGGWWAGGWR